MDYSTQPLPQPLSLTETPQSRRKCLTRRRTSVRTAVHITFAVAAFTMH
jgi:hypothetical protein